MAIDVKAHLPRTSLPIKFVRFSGPALSDGVETHRMDGVDIKVFCLAKTVADCFKYRHKIGLDVALEALREVIESGRCTIDDIWRYAKVCRVSNVMRPYMEVMAMTQFRGTNSPAPRHVPGAERPDWPPASDLAL